MLLPDAASGQNSFIAQVKEDKLDAFNRYVESEHGMVSQIVALDGSRLVCFHGDQGLKARVRRFDGVMRVSDNPEVQWIDPAKTILLGLSEVELSEDEGAADLSTLQWGLDAIKARAAWARSRGKGVRVAIIDSGIDADHRDLKSNLNEALSKSFVPNEDWRTKGGFGFNHGTHVAGIIAASDDGSGVTGIAPEAELIALKVASERTGSGDFAWLLEAIVYAAENDVDLANIGLGVSYPREGEAGIRAQEMEEMLGVVAGYAVEKGLTLIAPAGDDGRNLDDCCFYLPATADSFLSVTSTAPVGWANDPETATDKPSSYANFGTASVDFAAPGGDILYPSRDYCVIANLNRPCWTFDLVFSTVSNGWGWAAGSSISTAFITGIAALIQSEEKDTTPALIKQLLIDRAIRRGKNPGKDAHYGFGLANAFVEEVRFEHEHSTIEIVDGMLQEGNSEHTSPQTFELYQNYPNPFNPKTTINFHIPSPARVQVAVFDLMGTRVAILVDQELDQGCFNTSWNGRDEFGRTLASGVYMYKIDAGSFVDAKVMTFANN